MRIALDTNILHMNQPGIAAVAIGCLHKQICHGVFRYPLIPSNVFRADLDVVTVIENDRHLGKLQEIIHCTPADDYAEGKMYSRET
ncbi:MAG: hypothetical protein J6I40_04735 [Mailhella sp.]|nr:hypothetical protein [Mailhella sp.]